ncbi:cysteine dioxygenase family protein [Modestobacter sp. NPDC049651]|uniref:cysteine dioxygenase n=1 Tax=unclassified Modestobacter TaxID=2643866 RepID=UPI00340AA27B
MTSLAPAPTHAAPTTPPAALPSRAAALAVALTLHPDLWAPLVEYRAEERWTSLLDPAAAAGVLAPELHGDLAGAQVWLLSWLPGQGTVLHDHGASAGAFAVAGGTLTERVVATRTDGTASETRADLAAGRVRYFGDHYVHQVTNPHDEPAVSVHVYTPGLRWMNSYEVAGGRLVRTGTERAGVDW